MSAATWITMIAILAFVWGGFALALSTAVRKEAGKEAGKERRGDALPREGEPEGGTGTSNR